MENKKTYTLSVFTKIDLRLLNRITGIFLRRHVSFTSFNLIKPEENDMLYLTIDLCTSELDLIKIIKQIDKQLGVLKTYYSNNAETSFKHIALFKIEVPTRFSRSDQGKFLSTYECDLLEVTPTHVILSKQEELDKIKTLYQRLKPYGVLQLPQVERVTTLKENKASYTYNLDASK